MAFKVTKRKDGLYQKAPYITLFDGTRKRICIYGHSRQEVKEKYDKCLAEAISGHPVASSPLNVERYLTEWVKNPRGVREGTRLKYAGEIRKHIAPNIGKIKLHNLTCQNIQQMMDNLVKNGVSIRTTQILKNILSKALREAAKSNLTAPNITTGVELGKYNPKERVIWSEGEAKAFSEAIRTSKYQFFFIMYLTYGLRRGEAIAIRWEDINFDKKLIHIHQQCTFVGNKPTICKLKTAHSVRDLPILPHIETILKELQHKQEQGFVISENGEPINPNKVNREFKRLKQENNLPDVILHSLRHYAATALKNQGVTIKEVQMILGHADPKTTIQYYQHSSLEDRRSALEKYAETMGF